MRILECDCTSILTRECVSAFDPMHDVLVCQCAREPCNECSSPVKACCLEEHATESCVNRLVACPYGCEGTFRVNDEHFTKWRGCETRNELRGEFQDMMHCEVCNNKHATVRKQAVREYFENLFETNYFYLAEMIMTYSVLCTRSLARSNVSEWNMLPRDVMNLIKAYLFLLLEKTEFVNNNFQGGYRAGSLKWGYREKCLNLNLYSYVFNHECPNLFRCPVAYCHQTFSTAKEYHEHVRARNCKYYTFACWGCGAALNGETHATHQCIYQYVGVMQSTSEVELSETYKKIAEREDAFVWEGVMPVVVLYSMAEPQRLEYASKSKRNLRDYTICRDFEQIWMTPDEEITFMEETFDSDMSYYHIDYYTYRRYNSISLLVQFDRAFRISNRLNF